MPVKQPHLLDLGLFQTHSGRESIQVLGAGGALTSLYAGHDGLVVPHSPGQVALGQPLLESPLPQGRAQILLGHCPIAWPRLVGLQ